MRLIENPIASGSTCGQMMMLLEGILAVAAGKIIDIAVSRLVEAGSGRLSSWLRRDPTKAAFELALTRAYRTFARAYPQQVQELFDEHFLTGRAAPILAEYLQGRVPDPAQLAGEWANHVGFRGTSREVHAAELVAPASDFLSWLREEMRMLDAFQPIFDSRALDAIATSAQESGQLLHQLHANLVSELDAIRRYEASSERADTLDELILPAREVFDRVGLDQYVEREWLESDVDEFLGHRDRGAWLLVGEAGIGKTTFLAHLVATLGFPYLFAEQAPGTTNLDRALESLCAQIVKRFRLEPYLGRDALPRALRGHEDFLRRLLLDASSVLGAGERLVIIADGLSEAGVPPQQNVLGLPRSLPPGVFLLLSARPGSLVLRIDPTPKVMEMNANDPANQRDVRTYLERMARIPAIAQQLAAQGHSPKGLVTALGKASEGNWMYLHYVVEELKTGERAPLALDSLPQGLAGYYAEYWGRWRDLPEWDAIYAPLLTTLAAALEPLYAERLAEWAGVSASTYAVKRLLREDWGAFIQELPVDGASRYRPYHQSLRDFMLGDAWAGSAANSGMLEELRERAVDAHARLVEALRPVAQGQASEPAVEAYARRHLTTHLRRAGRQEELFSLVDDSAWESAQLAADPSGTLRLVDVREAWATAEDADQAAITNGHAVPLLGREVGYAMATARLRTLADAMPSVVLSALVSTGTWSLALALETIRQQTSPIRQAESLTEVAALLARSPEATRPDMSHEALAIVEGMQDEAARVAALTGIAPFLAEELVREAFTIAADFADEVARAAALTAVMPRLPDDLLQRAATIAVAIPIKSGLLYPLVALADRVGGEARKKILADARTAAVSLPLRMQGGTVLALINPWLAGSVYTLASALPDPERDELLTEALAAIRGSDTNDIGRLDALRGLVPHLSSHLVSEALELVAQSAADSWGRAPSLVAMTSQLPNGLLAKALAIARRTTDPQQRAEALAALASRLRSEERDDVLADALDAARAVSPYELFRDDLDLPIFSEGLWRSTRSRALVKLAPSLPLEVLGDALEAAREIHREMGRADALAALALRLPASSRGQVLDEALRAAREQPNDPSVRARTLFDLALCLPEDKQGPVLTDVLEVLKAVPRGLLLVDALSEVALRVQDEQALHAALDLAKEMSNPIQRARALTLAALRLTGEERTLVLAEALETARGIEEWWERARALSAMAAWLPAPECYHPAAEGLRAIRGHTFGTGPLEALCELAPYLPADTIPDALDFARKLHFPLSQATALGALASTMSGQTGADVASEALTRAREIPYGLGDGKWWDRLTIAMLAPWLPDNEQRRLIENSIAEVTGSKSSSVTGATLAGLAPIIPDDLFPEALMAAAAIPAEERGAALAALAPRVPSGLTAQALRAASEITDDGTRTDVLRTLAEKVDNLNGSELHALWVEALRNCTSRGADALVAAFGSLAPLVQLLGGEDAVWATIDVVRGADLPAADPEDHAS